MFNKNVTHPGFYALRMEGDPTVIDRKTIFRMGLSAFITALDRAGIHVIVVLNAPELSFNPRSCLPERGNSSCLMSRKEVEARQAEARRLIRLVLSEHPDAAVIDLIPYFCQQAFCQAKSDDGYILYSDNHHLGHNGSVYLLQKGFSDELAELLRRPALRH